MTSSKKKLLATEEVERRRCSLIQRMERRYSSAVVGLLSYTALPEPLTQPEGCLDLDPKWLEEGGKDELRLYNQR